MNKEKKKREIEWMKKKSYVKIEIKKSRKCWKKLNLVVVKCQLLIFISCNKKYKQEINRNKT